MSAYELIKQWLIPEITLWESHVITIIFTSIVAVAIVHFPLRSAYAEKRKSEEALRSQMDAEEQLRRSEARYRSFIESVEDSLYTVDPDLRYLVINARHLVRRGLSPDNYAGKQYGDFHSPEETRIFTDQVARVIREKSLVQAEYEQNGHHYLRKLNPVIDPVTADVIAVTVISTEITVRKQQEKKLESINRKLSLMNEITRHDMLNQLLALSSFIALAGEPGNDAAAREYLRKSEQIIDTIHAQITFSRDYQKIGVESPAWQNIATAIHKAWMPFRTAGPEVDPACAEYEILADPLLEKVFYNLLENAQRYAGPEPRTRFSATVDGERLLVICEDDGPGIPDENKEDIFERGFGKNTGLGLFLIREILAITGIAIRENGIAGRGTRFEMTVPAGSFRRTVRPGQVR